MLILRAKSLQKNWKFYKNVDFGKPFLRQIWRKHKVRKVSNAFISAGSKQKISNILLFCIFLTKKRSFWCLRLYHSVHFFEKHKISVFLIIFPSASIANWNQQPSRIVNFACLAASEEVTDLNQFDPKQRRRFR